MNSLSDLNNFGATQVTFTDNRTAKVIFYQGAPQNDTVTIEQTQDVDYDVLFNVREIIDSATANFEYLVDLTTAPANSSINTSGLPAGITVNESGGIYTFSDIDTAAEWDLIKVLPVDIDPTYTGSFSFTVTYRYFNETENVTKTFSAEVSVTVNDIILWDTTTLEDVYYSASSTIDNMQVPGIITEIVQSYTVTLTPSATVPINTISSSGSGGTTNFNATTKVYTISGTKAQVLSHINSLVITTTSGAVIDWTLQYQVNGDGLGDTVTQSYFTTEYLSAPRTAQTYTTAVSSNVGPGGPQITDSNGSSGTYTLEIQPQTQSQITTMNADPFNDGYDNGTEYSFGTIPSGFDRIYDFVKGEFLSETEYRVHLAYRTADNLTTVYKIKQYNFNGTNWVETDLGISAIPVDEQRGTRLRTLDRTAISIDKTIWGASDPGVPTVRIYQESGGVYNFVDDFQITDFVNNFGSLDPTTVPSLISPTKLIVGTRQDNNYFRTQVYTRSNTSQNFSLAQTASYSNTNALQWTRAAKNAGVYMFMRKFDYAPAGDAGNLFLLQSLGSGFTNKQTFANKSIYGSEEWNNYGFSDDGLLLWAYYAWTQPYGSNKSVFIYTRTSTSNNFTLATEITNLGEAGKTDEFIQAFQPPQSATSGTMVVATGELTGGSPTTQPYKMYHYEYQNASWQKTAETAINFTNDRRESFILNEDFWGTKGSTAYHSETDVELAIHEPFVNTPSYNNSNKTLTISSDNKNLINTAIDTIDITSQGGVTDDILLDYTVTTPDSVTYTRTQTVENS